MSATSVHASSAISIVGVALDVPLPRLFDYRLPGASAPDIGRRVVVPFGKGRKVGVIVEVRERSDVQPDKLRDAERVLDDMAPLPDEWLQLARFCSDYYQRPLGEVIHAALPPRLRRPLELKRTIQALTITAAGRSALAETSLRSKTQRAILTRLTSEESIAVDELSAGTRRELLRKGWIEPAPAPRGDVRFVERHALVPAQRTAVDAVRAALGGYRPFLLLGVTGSGKTEVYLHLIAATLARGQQALVLVPEINLTPQLEQQFRERFPATPLVTLTSALADNDRAERWLTAQAGHARIVLGTRLTVFAPMPELGLVIVDEEHDPSFKQQEGVRYSARDLAVFRASRTGVPIVLGSATPSLESFAHAGAGRYTLIELPERARAGARLPSVRLVDTRNETARDGLSTPLVAAIEARLARGEQTLVFLNRRGYAPVLACGACGWTSDCPRCSAHLVVHLSERRLRCHHCGYVEAVPRHCPACGNVDLQPFGRGTQRLEEAIVARFANARVLRIDSDTTRAKGRWEALRAQIADGDADILVGTQILAKGHDFPRLTLVGVLNADAALLAADYRAPERLFAQLYQVAGRAGRAELSGEVLVQTRYPHHQLYQALTRYDFAGFAHALLQEREQAGFPPHVFEAALRAESRDRNEAVGFLEQACATAPAVPAEITVFDPVPMSVARLAGWERAQVLVQSHSRRVLQGFLREWTATLYAMKSGNVRWHLDVDPIEF